LPNNLRQAAAAIFNNKLVVVGGYYNIAVQVLISDMVYELDDHASQAAQGRWRALTARLNTARRRSAAIAHEGKLFVCGGCDAGFNVLRSVESFDPATGAWQLEGDMTKVRYNFSLFVFQHELYAVGGDQVGTTTIEKRNKATQQWEFVADCGQDRSYCAAALVGSKLFLFGGYGSSESTFDFFDLDSKKWASKTEGTYEKESARQLPRQVHLSKAVLITPLALLIKEWTNMNVVKLEDRDTARCNERFEAITGNAIQWDA
jgi:N-acetylneuraminic acid mutarotase